MNGDISVTSEYGIGSCFKIWLEQEVTEYYEVVKEEEMKEYRAYILVDDPNERWYLTRILSQMGVPSIFLHNEMQLPDIEKKADDKAKTMLFYSFEKYGTLVQRERLTIKTIALVEYYTPADGLAAVPVYLRRPFDVFNVSKAIFYEAKEEVVPEENRSVVSFQNVHVAVVDDNRVNLKVAVTLLKEIGVMPEAFTSGEAIIKALEHGREYDIIFMDHMMPEPDGIETTKQIRAMSGKYPKSAVIIALTANAIEGVERAYLECGMDDWLFKPVNLERIEEKLIKYLPEDKKIRE